MTDASHRLLRLNAALDGELDTMEQVEFDRALRDDPVLAAEFRRLATVRDAVRRAAPRDTAPQALADRIAALAIPPVVPIRSRTFSMRSAMALAASFAVLGLVAGAGIATLRAPAAGRGVSQALVSDFTRAALSGAPYDIASSDRHTVKPWLASRATVSADIVDLAAQGFALAGGRIAVVDRIPTPTLVYRHNEHFIAVSELPFDASGDAGDGKAETIDGYHVARWPGTALRYVAVSDADEATLAEFVAAFKQARKPAVEPAGG
jgi:anti-sigma factor RsiW